MKEETADTGEVDYHRILLLAHESRLRSLSDPYIIELEPLIKAVRENLDLIQTRSN